MFPFLCSLVRIPEREKERPREKQQVRLVQTNAAKKYIRTRNKVNSGTQNYPRIRNSRSFRRISFKTPLLRSTHRRTATGEEPPPAPESLKMASRITRATAYMAGMPSCGSIDFVMRAGLPLNGSSPV